MRDATDDSETRLNPATNRSPRAARASRTSTSGPYQPVARALTPTRCASRSAATSPSPAPPRSPAPAAPARPPAPAPRSSPPARDACSPSASARRRARGIGIGPLASRARYGPWSRSSSIRRWRTDQAVGGGHEVHVAGVAGRDDGLPVAHRLAHREAEALGAVERDVAVAELRRARRSRRAAASSLMMVTFGMARGLRTPAASPPATVLGDGRTSARATRRRSARTPRETPRSKPSGFLRSRYDEKSKMKRKTKRSGVQPKWARVSVVGARGDREYGMRTTGTGAFRATASCAKAVGTQTSSK